MGMDAEALLFFGFPLDEDQEYEDWDEKLQQHLGVHTPEVEYSEEVKKEYHRFWEDGRAALAEYRKGFDESFWGVLGVDWYGSCEYQQYFAHAVCLRADWEKPKEFEMPELPPGTIDRFKRYCEAMSIEWQEPKWYWTARWG